MIIEIYNPIFNPFKLLINTTFPGKIIAVQERMQVE